MAADSSTQERNSRRDFIKTAGLVTGNLVLQEAARKFGGNEISIPLEQTPVQTSEKFLGIMRRIVNDPSSENKALLESWIKLNVALNYFQVRGYELTSKALKHFLYGQGQSVDIGESYVLSMTKGYHPYDESKDKASLRLQTFCEDELQHLVGLTPNDCQTLNDLSKGIKPSRDKIKLFYQASGGSADVYFSLHHYQLSVEGFIASSEYVDESLFYLNLTNPKFGLYDRYDWHPNQFTEFGVLDFTDRFLSSIGIRDGYGFLCRTLGMEKAYHLSRTDKLSFTDKEGVELQKNGIGIPFDMVGKFYLPEVKLKISKMYIRS